MFPQQMTSQQFTQQNMNAFSQNSFPNQQSFQMGMPATNQIPQMCMNTMGANQMGLGHGNGSTMTMQAQMVLLFFSNIKCTFQFLFYLFVYLDESYGTK